MNVFGNSSNKPVNKIDTSLLVQKPYLREYFLNLIVKKILT